MNKKELIDAIAQEAEISKSDAKKALEAFIHQTTKILRGGGHITLIGFGTFKVAKRAARNGRNPQTGKALKITAKRVAKFKAGHELASELIKAGWGGPKEK